MTAAKANLHRPTKAVKRTERAKTIRRCAIFLDNRNRIHLFTQQQFDNGYDPLLFLSANSKLSGNMLLFHRFRVNGRGKRNEKFADTKRINTFAYSCKWGLTYHGLWMHEECQ